MPELTMPRLSDTMQEGTIARWLKKPGEVVERGEVVAEIETDKATMELEAYDAGVLEKILVEEGQTVPIGQPIALVGSGEAAESPEAGSGVAPSTEHPEPDALAEEREAPSPGSAAPHRPLPQGEARTPSPLGRGQGVGASPPPSPEPPPRPSPAATGEGGGEKVKASPMARAIAREHGIDLHTIQGSGPGGRVVRADVDAAIAADGRASTLPSPVATGKGAELRSAAGGAPQPPSDEVEEIPLTNMRRVVARRMLESVQSAPHFFLFSVVEAEALVAFRAELNERLAASGEDFKLSLNDLLIKACALALRNNPDVNVAFAGDKILRHKRVHIGLAVALEGGLIVPVVRDVDQKSLSQIAREAKALIERARAGRLTQAEYTGGTFTISNLGMFGIDHFTAIINPPEAAILAVGAVRPEPVAHAGQVVVRQTMKLTLSIDHRALDGATAARFLQQLQAILEEPLRIVI